MEKTDVVIALVGAAVLAVAITASALYGGVGVGAAEFTVTFPESTTPLAPQSFSTQGSGEGTLTFPVAAANVTKVAFTVTAQGPAGAAAPGVRILVTTPEGEEFSADGTTIEVPVAPAPTGFDARAASPDAVALPPPRANATGDWVVVVQVTSPTPLPVPYTVTVDGTAHHYAAQVAPRVVATR